jgi:hypothetical protein
LTAKVKLSPSLSVAVMLPVALRSSMTGASADDTMRGASFVVAALGSEMLKDARDVPPLPSLML